MAVATGPDEFCEQGSYRLNDLGGRDIGRSVLTLGDFVSHHHIKRLASRGRIKRSAAGIPLVSSEAPEAFFSAARFVERCQTQPRGQVASGLELFCIVDGGNDI